MRRRAIRQHRISPQGISSLPGFAESLRLLLVEEQYTLEDVGMMFNVTRERIRQIANTLGITDREKHGGLFSVRIWQDDEHRFRPAHKWIVKRAQYLDRKDEEKHQRAAKYAARRAKAVAELKDLARQLERTPTIRELGQRLGLGPNPGEVPSYLGCQYKTYYTLGDLWTDAGLTIRTTGQQVHPNGGRQRQTHCGKGHPMSGDNLAIYEYHGKECRRCRTCERAGASRRYRDRKRRSHA